jgi:LemA protein
MKKILIGIAVAILVIGMYFFNTYNSLISKSTSVDGQWAQVETQYQRRYDLIPNLVASTKGFMEQEKEIFETIAQARTQYGGAKTLDEKVTSATNLDSALSRLLVIMENYPTLKSNETVAKLMDELAGTENRINVERVRFNEAAGSYNITIKRIPTNFVASIFGFKEKPFFKSVSGAEEAPKVEL